jgi:hypothetical protein
MDPRPALHREDVLLSSSAKLAIFDDGVVMYVRLITPTERGPTFVTRKCPILPKQLTTLCQSEPGAVDLGPLAIRTLDNKVVVMWEEFVFWGSRADWQRSVKATFAARRARQMSTKSTNSLDNHLNRTV